MIFGLILTDGLVIEAHPGDHAGRVIFDQHIHFRDQVTNDGFAVFAARIETEAQLAAILLDEVPTALVLNKWHRARAVAVGCKFDLDNLGAHLRHQLGNCRTGDELREIKRLVAVEYVLGSVDRHDGHLFVETRGVPIASPGRLPAAK